MELTESSRICGRISITVHNEDGSVDQHVEADNIMCTVGYQTLVACMLWSAAIDQNSNLGFLLNQTYMAPVYGAVGSGSTTPAAGDIKLTSELGRSTVYIGSNTGTQFTLAFFFGTPNSWSITEAGVFLQATSTANSGALLDHALISPTVTKSVGQTATLSVTFTFA